ncbi:MAG TPA: hypothetical protein ENH32_03370 [Proteobacteria bacterium]|nr:hypothetical protein BMS3Abin14_00224 [bacterium BMS3Abin14]HDL52991.1 hypothetical protein [Pseudomonadota bacterium]
MEDKSKTRPATVLTFCLVVAAFIAVAVLWTSAAISADMEGSPMTGTQRRDGLAVATFAGGFGEV